MEEIMHTPHPIRPEPAHRTPIYAFCIFLALGAWIFSIHSVPEARADADITIGLLEEPKTLNVWLASDAWSGKVLSQIYQPLFIREPKDLKLVPWLAVKDPVPDADALTYTVKLRPSKWSDGSELTSEDVAFTGNLIKEFKPFPKATPRTDAGKRDLNIQELQSAFQEKDVFTALPG
jgi:ABC-type transport system substrate-binding protein